MGFGLQSARFFTTVAKPEQIPPPDRPEVAFAGRSNAGKSSAINRLCHRTRLAFASKTPGRTQALNYFSLGPDEAPAHSYLVDTPGYGYAAVPLSVKHEWQGLAGWYLRERRNLSGVVLMVDCRRLLTDKDLDLLAWVPASVERLILITKADKLKRQAQNQTMDKIKQQYSQAMPDVAANFLLFSSTSGLGVEPARTLILQWLGIDPNEPKTPWQPSPESTTAPGAGAHPKRTATSKKPKKNPAASAPGDKPVNRGTRSGRRSG